MNRVRIEDVENDVQPAAVMRHLTEPLGLTDVAINYYELEPGDSFAFAYHSHEIQEEVFCVLSGTATFETEEGPVEVESDGVIRFGREEFQRGWNYGHEPIKALAIGAPLEYGEVPRLRDCPECGEMTDSDLDRIEEAADGREEEREAVGDAVCRLRDGDRSVVPGVDGRGGALSAMATTPGWTWGGSRSIQKQTELQRFG